MASPPRVRARHIKSLLEAIDRLPQATAVRSRIGASLSGAAQDASVIEWLPYEYNLAVTGAVYLTLPATEADAFFRAQAAETFSGPLLRGLVDTAVRLFGMDPGSWTRWVPRGWDQIFQDVGNWTVGRAEPGEVRLTLAGLPRSAVEDPHWPRAVAGSLSAICDLARKPGAAQLLAVDPAAARIEYVLRWEAGGGAER